MIPLLALFFSLVAPGAGHVFVGKFTQGIVIGIFFALWKSALLPLGIRVFRLSMLQPLLKFLYVCNLLYIMLVCYAVFSAFWYGLKGGTTHFWYAVVFSVCVMVTYKKTFNRVIFTLLCGRTGVYEILCNLKNISTEKR